MMKEVTGLEQYTRSSVGHKELRVGCSVELLEDKKWCRMCTDDRCVLRDSGK